MQITIGVARERVPGEHRVALVPETAKKFKALGAGLRMEQSAGTESHFLDSDYTDITMVGGIAEAYGPAGLILRVTPPSAEEIAAMRPASCCTSPKRGSAAGSAQPCRTLMLVPSSGAPQSLTAMGTGTSAAGCAA